LTSDTAVVPSGVFFSHIFFYFCPLLFWKRRYYSSSFLFPLFSSLLTFSMTRSRGRSPLTTHYLSIIVYPFSLPPRVLRGFFAYFFSFFFETTTILSVDSLPEVSSKVGGRLFVPTDVPPCGSLQTFPLSSSRATFFFHKLVDVLFTLARGPFCVLSVVPVFRPFSIPLAALWMERASPLHTRGSFGASFSVVFQNFSHPLFLMFSPSCWLFMRGLAFPSTFLF